MDERILSATKQWTLVQPVVSAFVGSIVRDFATRDDILQETAVAVLQNYDRYDTTRPFQAWALGIARNQVRLYLRKQKRDLVVFDDQTIAQIADSFEHSAESMRTLEHLQTCIHKLDAKSMSLLQLRYVADCKPAAIANQIQSTANAVAKTLQRIRDLLRECIQQQSAKEALK